MSKRSYVAAILFCVGVAGCTPAHFVQRVRPAPPCDVRVCISSGSGHARCQCQTHEQVQRQIRETYGRQFE